MNIRKLPAELLIIIGGLILFVPFLGATHLFDWDEVNFAEASREMLATHNYSIPQIEFQPFWEKPPLFFWLQVLSMKVFGVNEFASRFPNAVCGILTLLVLFRIGKRQLNETFGWIWVFVYAGSLLPQFYFKSGIIDPWFNLFIFLSIYQLSLYTWQDRRSARHVIWAGLFAGFAVMTKGPVALLVIGLTYFIYAATNRFRLFMKFQHILLFILLSMLVGGIWFIALLLNGQQHVIVDFFNYQIKLFSTEDAGHGGPFFYHFIILLIGCFPAAALSILSMRKINQAGMPLHLHKFMLILFWVVLILFSIVKTKIVHYSSLCYYPLTFLAAFSFYLIWKRIWQIPVWNKWLQFVTGLLLAIAILAAASIEQWKSILLVPGRIDDEFAKANLQANVHWSGWEKLPGVLFFIGIIVFIIYARKNNRKALTWLFACSMIAINGTIILITPKVEPYSQGAMIEFFQDKAKENGIVETIRFKSYANLFYAKRPPEFSKPVADSLIHFDVRKEVPVYYAGKIQNAEENEKENPKLQRLYEKNGFVFYKLNR